MLSGLSDEQLNETIALHNRVEPLGLTPSVPFFSWVDWYRPPQPFWVHTHQGVEIGIVLEGETIRCFEDVSITCGPGDVWVCAPWEPHGWDDISPQLTGVAFHFLPEFLGEEHFEGRPWFSLLAVSPKARPRVTSKKLREKIVAIGWDLLHEAREQPPAWEDAVRLNLLRLLLELTRGWHPGPQIEKKESGLRENFARVMEALLLVERVFPRHVNVTEAAHACGLSEVRFTQVFKNIIDMTFGKYQLHYRLRYARRLLQTTNLTIEAIAQDSGFVDTSHLVHTFTKQYGCTPSEYRNEQTTRPLKNGQPTKASRARSPRTWTEPKSSDMNAISSAYRQLREASADSDA